MKFLSKTALGLLAAAGLMAFTTPNAEARHYSHHRHHGHYGHVYYGRPYYYGYRSYGPRVVVRSYDPYYYDSYYYGRPYYYGYGGPSFSFAFGGHGWGGHHHGHHHHR